MKNRFITVLTILLLLAMQLTFVSTEFARSKELTSFSTGVSPEVVLDGPGTDDSARITLDTYEVIKSARFNISNGQNLGSYPLTPSIDIGNDGDIEWAYNDVGYGSWGQQNFFSNGGGKTDFNLKSGTSFGYVTFPEGAEVTSATLQSRGIFDSTYDKHIAAYDGIDNCWSLENGDIDGDGYEDILGVENIEGGHLFWYENPQSMGSPWPYHVIDTQTYGYQTKLTDMDGDLDQDVVLTIRSNNGGIRWYENDAGDGSSWTPHDINMTFNYAGTFAFYDINGNGSEDIVLLSDYTNFGRLAWIEKPANLANNWTTHIINNSVVYMSHLDVADMDKDTNPDIVMTSDYWNPNIGGIYLYEGPDDPVNETWLGHKIASFGGPHEVAVIDLDTDSNPDIVVANASNNKINWYKAPGATFTGTWTTYDIATGISGAKGVDLADADGDADLDVVCGSQWGEFAYWLEQPSSGVTNPWTVHQIGTGIDDARIVISADLDNANELDLVGYGYDFGQLDVLVENTGTYQQYAVEQKATAQPTRMVSGNFDQQNGSDIAYISYYSESLCVRRTGSDPSLEWTFEIVDDALASPNGLNATDIDKDGDLDLVVCSYGGRDIYWYENRYDTNPASPWLRRIIVENTGLGYHRYLVTGDIDGANGTDVIVYERWTDGANSPNNCLVWYEAPADPTDGGQTWNRYVIASHLRGTMAFDIADIDDDGYNDVVFTQYRTTGGYFGNISWARHPTGYANSKDRWQVRLISIDHQYPVGLECAYIDSDDIPDIVVTDYVRDSLKWYSPPTDPVSPTATWNSYYIDMALNNAWGITCADIGNDGKTDIAVTDSYDDRVIWYTAPSDPTITINWKAKVLDTTAVWSWDVAFGDFSGDELIDIAVLGNSPGRIYWYDLQPLYASNAYLDIGFNSNIDWTIPTLNTTQTSPDLSIAFNAAIAAQTATTDTFGNKIVKVPILLTGPERNASLFGLDITYNAGHSISGTKLVDELNEYLRANNDTASVDIPILVSMASSGKIRFKDLQLNMNEYPVLDPLIPENFSIDEDTKNDILIDLRDYFSDDYTLDNDLEFLVTGYTEQENVDVYIYSNYFLGVDSTKVENWFGVTQVSVCALDEDGFNTSSNQFNVTINSVNDKPVAGPAAFSNAVMEEGGYYLLNLSAKEYFTDPDGDKLYYTTDIDQQSLSIRGNLSVVYDPAANTLNFSASDDWTISGLLLNIFCDDQEDVGGTLSKNIMVDVTNIVEPLAWEKLPIITVQEDTENKGVIDLKTYVFDPDHPNAPVSFYVQEYENSSFIDIDLHPGGILDIAPHSNFFGDSIVKIKAENQFSSVSTSLFVLVESVNDPPVLSDLYPRDDDVFGTDEIQFSWTGHDVEESNLQYTLTLEESGTGTVSTYDTSDSQYTLTGLKDNTTYYWMVSVSDGAETVDSNKLMFRISFAEAEKYDLSIDCPSIVIIKTGEYKNVVITITNEESVQNHVIPWIEEISPEISSFTELTQETKPVYVDPGQEKTIVLRVDLTEFDVEPGEYQVSLKFQNGRTKKTETKNVTVRVEKDEDGGSLGAVIAAVIIILLVVIIVIAVVAVLVWRKRKQDEDADLYDFKTVPAEGGDEQITEQEYYEQDDRHLRADIEEDLSKILETAGVEEIPEEEGVLEPEIEDSSLFDEERGPPGADDMPAMDISPIGDDPVQPVEDYEEMEAADLQRMDEVEEAPVQDFSAAPGAEQSGRESKVKTRYSYTYSKRPKRLSKDEGEEDELVELKPMDIDDVDDDDRPARKSASKKKSKYKQKSANKKKKK